MQNRTKTKPQVVIVDDDSDFRSILRTWLASGYDTFGIAGGEELLDDLSILEPDLIMLDVHLPGPDGFKLCDKIRSDSRFARTPILFLTASKSKSDFCRYLEVGGTAYLTKPVERSRLLSEIYNLMAEAP